MRAFHSLSLLAASAEALTSAQWRSQSIYQVITDRFSRTDGSTTAACDMGNYCGGTFQGLINQLDYIQGMGFTAIWISPVIGQLTTTTPYGLPYHGYWPQDLYSINPKFGTAADLKALSAALHGRGMYLMVDVVPNHSAYNGAPTAVNYTKFNPFNDQKYYHTPYCAIDYSNSTSVVDCWMGDTTVSLPDLRVEDATVQTMFNSWVKDFVSNYTIDGLRIDSAMQMSTSFFPNFVSSAGVYAVGEVVNGNPNTLCNYQNYMPGVLNYAAYYWIVRAFTSTSATMTELSNNIQWLASVCNDITLVATFAENHDQPRLASITSDASLIQNAIAFTMLNDGIPIIYYGQEQGFSGASDPNNREPFWPSGYNTSTTLYGVIGKLNLVRNTAISNYAAYATNTATVVSPDTKTMVTIKGGLIAVLTNDGSAKSTRNITLPQANTNLPAGTKMLDVLSCKTFTADLSGNLVVTITNGFPMALYGANALSGSGVCSGAFTSSSSSAVSSTTTSSSVVKITGTALSTGTPKTISTTAAIPTTSSTLSTSSKSTSVSVAASTTSQAPSTTSASIKSTSSTAPSTSSAPSTAIKTISSIVVMAPSTTSSSSASVIKTTTSTVVIASSSTQSSTASPTTSKVSTTTTATSSTSMKSTTSSATTSPIFLTCPSSNSTTYVSGPKTFLIECGKDYAGNDLSSVSVGANNLTQCIGACVSTTGCVGVALSGAGCYLKSAIGSATSNAVWGARIVSSSISASALSTTSSSSSSIAESSAVSSTSKTATTSSSAAACTGTSSIITFQSNITTAWGTSAYIVGSGTALGSWNTSQAISMDSSDYPIWAVNVTLPAGTTVQWKYIQIDGSGNVSWEADPNRNVTVPYSCGSGKVQGVVSGTWQS